MKRSTSDRYWKRIAALLLLIIGVVLISSWASADGASSGSGTSAGPPDGGDADPKDPPCGRPANNPSDPVDVATGEFYIGAGNHVLKDLTIPGRGLGLDFTREYRSGFAENSPIGYGWDLRIRHRLQHRSDGNIVISTGTCHETEYVFNGSDWDAPAGVAAGLVENPDGSYTQTFADGMVREFDTNGLVTQKRDRHGNTISYAWTAGTQSLFGIPEYPVSTLTSPNPTSTFHSLIRVDHRLESVQDPAGRQVDFAYGPMGRLESITDWTGRQWTYGHDDFGNLTSVTAPVTADHPSGATTTYEYADPYDPHNLTGIVTPELQGTGGSYLQQVYDPDGRVTQQTLGNGEIVTLSYDSGNPTTTLTDGNGTDSIYEFDSEGAVTSETVVTRGVRASEPVGTRYTTSYTYDSLARKTQVVFPEGNRTEWVHPPVEADPRTRNNVIEIRHHPKLGSAEPWLVWAYTYKTQHNQLGTVTDPEGNITEYFYDLNDDLVRIDHPIVPEGTPQDLFAWNVHGQLTDATDANGNITHFEYDSNGYLQQMTRAYGSADAATTQFLPDALGRATVVTSPNGNATTLSYDAWDKIESIGEAAPFGYVTAFHYDANGNLIRTEQDSGDPGNPQTTQFEYGARNQLRKIIDELGNEVEYFYDGTLSLAAFEDEEDNRHEFLSDERSLPYSNTDAELRTEFMRYHGNGRLAEVVDGNGNSTLYGYDPFDRLDTVTHEDATTTAVAYDMNSNRSGTTTRAQQAISYSYDALNRLRSRVALEGTDSFTYDLGGRLQSASNSDISLSYAYNGRDQMVEERVTALAGFPAPGALPLVVATQYDAAGNPTRITHPDSSYLTYVPDNLNRLERIQDSIGVDLVVNSYDEVSRVVGRVFASGASVQISLDAAGRVDSILHRDQGSTPLEDLDFVLDPTGAVDYIVNSTLGTIGYGYDLTKQITNVDYDDVLHPAEDTTLVYDDAGNRTSVAVGTDPAVAYSTNSLNQYDSISGAVLTYDDNGNLQSDGARAQTWDSKSRLVAATVGGVTATYAYDPFGRRIRKTVDLGGGDLDAWFLWSDDRLLEERDDSGVLLARYNYGDGNTPIRAELDSGSGLEPAFVHSNHLGTPQLLTDASGSVIWRASYWAFGKADLDASNSVTFNLRFPGQYYDEETGLHYNRFRYYDSEIGRYISTDPIGQAGGFNTYSYALGDPVNRFDPYGLDTWGFGVDGSICFSGYCVDVALMPVFDDDWNFDVNISGSTSLSTSWFSVGAVGFVEHTDSNCLSELTGLEYFGGAYSSLIVFTTAVSNIWGIGEGGKRTYSGERFEAGGSWGMSTPVGLKGGQTVGKNLSEIPGDLRNFIDELFE